MNYTNLEEVTNKALETGEKIVSLECPCCGKTYYALESEAGWSNANRGEGGFGVDPEIFSVRQLGRKCPHCGFITEISPGKAFDPNYNSVKDEIKAKEMAEQIREETLLPWSVINNMGV